MSREQYEQKPDPQREVIRQVYFGYKDKLPNTFEALCDRTYYPDATIQQTLHELVAGGNLTMQNNEYKLSPGLLVLFELLNAESVAFLKKGMADLEAKLEAELKRQQNNGEQQNDGE